MSNETIVAAINDLLLEIEREAATLEPLNLEELYVKVEKVLYSIPRRRYGLSQEVAEDVVQQAWLLFLEKRGFIRCARTWLAGTVANLCKQHFERSSRVTSTDGVLDTMIDETAPQQDDVIAIRQAMRRLDSKGRRLCTMIAIEGRSYEEVCAATGIAPGSVGPLYIRAKTRLRKMLEN